MAAGQISAKYGSLQTAVSAGSLRSSFNGFHVLSYFFLILRAPLWFFILKKNDISSAYPVLALNYVIILIFSALIFSEKVTTGKIAGSLLITAGVLLVITSSKISGIKTINTGSEI
ncbi:MAG: EamA family transporter [Spirochaetia bacterium]|jgi:drug/metabolite transporter (DMT)-like permease|nr:EamA family transporter [Spirochaetia bacterium]